jgi:MFS family permease
VPHLTTAGIDDKTASVAVMITVLCSLAGRVGFGWLSDTVSKKWLFILTVLLQAIGLLVFSQVTKVIHLILFFLAYAPGYGGNISLRATMVADYYGRANFGTIYGVLVGLSMVGGVGGPIVAGYAYDLYQNFRLIFILFSLINFFTALVLLFLRRPRIVD